jgi:hypothetical protein
MVYMQRGEALSTHEVKNTGSWDSLMAPRGRSSLIKYLNRTSKGNSLNYCHHHELGGTIYRHLGIESLPEDNSLDDKVGLPLVLKCLRLAIGILPFEEAHESMLPNLIMPTLDINIKGPRLLRDLHVYQQAIFLDGIRKKVQSTILQLRN